MVEASLGDSWAGIVLLFVAFLLFFGASLGYGSALRNRMFPKANLLSRLSDCFLFASLVLWGVGFFLAAIHALSFFPRAFYAAIFLPGLYFIRPLARECWRALWPKRKWALAMLTFIFFVRALTAALPSQHGDPLLYHLLGPRLWVEGGGFLMHPNLPNALLASSWESLYLWPQLFWFSRVPLYGLVEAHLFSQWLHLFLAWGGCALLVMRLARGSIQETWLPLTGLAALFISGVQWTAPLAKNDAGIAFWVLGAVVYFVEAVREKNFRKTFFAGVFAGLAVCGKITALLSLGPLLAVLSIFSYPWKAPIFFVRATALWFGGFLAGALPIYARNYFLSQNPFFPLFPKIFPSPWMSQSWEAHFAQVHPSSPLHALPRVFSRYPELLRETPWAIAALAFLAWLLVLERKKNKEWLALVLGSYLAYVVFVITQSPEIELRYLGASLMLLGAGGVMLAARAAALLPKKKMQMGAMAAVLITLLATSKLPLHVLRKIWLNPLGVHALPLHSAGEAKAWLRANAGNGFTVVAGDNETYYLTPLGVTVLSERPDLDAANNEPDFSKFIEKLCALTGARFLLDARPAIGVEKKFGAAALAPAKIFSAQGANIYDLRVLEANAPPARLHCH